MAEADVKLTTVSTGGAKLGSVIPDGSLSKEEGKSVITGRWKIPGVESPVSIQMTGSSLRSVETPFGNQPFMAEIEESEQLFGIHVTMGGFPMKAWLTKAGGSPVLAFSNGGRWSKV